jgi:hypothetical protein
MGGLFSLLGTAIGGLFGMKQQQGVVVTEGIKSIGAIVGSEGERETAQANILSAEASSGYFLAAMWRPLMMITFLGIIVSYWFGYTPPNLLVDKMPPMIDRLFSLIELGIGGYIGARTLEKIFGSLQLGSALKNYVSKKLV